VHRNLGLCQIASTSTLSLVANGWQNVPRPPTVGDASFWQYLPPARSPNTYRAEACIVNCTVFVRNHFVCEWIHNFGINGILLRRAKVIKILQPLAAGGKVHPSPHCTSHEGAKSVPPPVPPAPLSHKRSIANAPMPTAREFSIGARVEVHRQYRYGSGWVHRKVCLCKASAIAPALAL
jgi:hypothetical protein